MSAKHISFLKWLSTVMFLLAASMIALRLNISQYGYIAFIIGHLALTYLFIKEHDRPMLVQNAAFLIIDFIGVYRWFFDAA